MIADLFKSLGRPVVVGHRGAMSYAPENTLASFEWAAKQGADVVELDVHLTRDGVPVVIHDETLDRTTDGTGAVCGALLDDLQRLDAGGWYGAEFAGARIPTLDEALEWSRTRIPLAIEIKGLFRPTNELVDAVVAAVLRHDMLDRVIVIAFDHPALARARASAADLFCGALYACRPSDPIAVASAAGAQALLPHWSFVVPEDVALAHRAGLVVQPWETSAPSELEYLVRAGVDGVASNSPDVALRVITSGQGS